MQGCSHPVSPNPAPAIDPTSLSCCNVKSVCCVVHDSSHGCTAFAFCSHSLPCLNLSSSPSHPWQPLPHSFYAPSLLSVPSTLSHSLPSHVSLFCLPCLTPSPVRRNRVAADTPGQTASATWPHHCSGTGQISPGFEKSFRKITQK